MSKKLFYILYIIYVKLFLPVIFVVPGGAGPLLGPIALRLPSFMGDPALTMMTTVRRSRWLSITIFAAQLTVNAGSAAGFGLYGNYCVLSRI